MLIYYSILSFNFPLFLFFIIRKDCTFEANVVMVVLLSVIQFESKLRKNAVSSNRTAS